MKSGASLDVGNFSHSVRYELTSATTLTGDFRDTLGTAQDCAQKGINDEQCHLASNQRWDYSINYSGIKNLKLFGTIHNLFGRHQSADYRAFGGNQGYLPPNADDLKGRYLSLGLEYRFF